ncbi:NrdH-redoxin [Aerococcus agrisoli]|uniref:NrdH-redoxin n=1 Tax=Aerococcus agrisoli TaxID=2487350 RepID=A0A3N4GFG0_9LACT|nr:glutaredoxin domain-containing protein [Aerococcus agrisoli]RPA60925.1 NrdH-redoxin [Aerococcus agrisoli]
MTITVYAKSGCPQCIFAKKYLQSQDVPFEEKRVDLEETYLEEVREMGYQALPVIADSTGNAFHGYVPEKLEALVAAWRA